MTWQDDGVTTSVEISTDGTWVAPFAVTRETFLSGGANGIPLSWSLTIPGGVDASMVTFSVSGDNEFTEYSNSNNANFRARYEVYKDYWTNPGSTYQIQVDVKGYPPRGPDSWPAIWVGLMKAGQTQPIGNLFTNAAYVNGMPDSTNWYTLVLTTRATLSDGSPADRLRVIMANGYKSGGVSGGAAWGTTWRNLVITDIDQYVPPSTLVFQSVLCDTVNATIRYGRSRFTERYDVGTFQIRLNNVRGDYSYHEDNTGFRPGRMLRMKATYKGVTYPLCYGVIDRVKTIMEKDGTATVDLTVLDTTSFTSDTTTPNITPRAYNLNGGDPFLTGTRINSLLDYSGVQKSVRAIDAGQWSTQVVTQSGRAVREEIGITADSEGGAFYGERDGRFIYRDRTWASVDPKANTVQAQITAVPGEYILDSTPDEIPSDLNAPTICPSNMETDWSRERVINSIRLSVAGGGAYVFLDSTSQGNYGIHSYQRLDFVNAKPDYTTSPLIKDQLTTRANDIFATSLNSQLRVQSITFRPDPTSWVFALTAFLNWAVRVYYYNGKGEWGFSTVVLIQSVTHAISTKGWTVALNLDQPIAYNDYIEILEPSPTGWDLGIWDTDYWDV